MEGTEKRCYNGNEFRAVETTQGEKIIEGHAAVFNQPTNIGGEFIEEIERGAFDGCDLSDVALFVNHDTRRIPLARTTSGTLIVSIDNVGLAIRARLDVENNPDARALYSSVKRGDLRALSFAFTVAEDEWFNLESEMPTRRVKKIARVFECSAANYPAYEKADVHARAKQILIDAKEKEVMTFEEFSKHMKQYETEKRNAEIDERTAIVNDPNAVVLGRSADFIQGKGFIPAEERSNRFNTELTNQRVQAGQDLKERRAVISEFNVFGERRALTVTPADGGNASIVVPSSYSENINPDFPVVSSLVDAVAHLSLNGGESFSQPYVANIGAGDYRNEGEDYAEAETVFGYAQINRTKITAYCELTEELEKLPAAAYADLVFQNIRTSIRKVLTREILFGNGISDNQKRLVGIFSDKATAIDSDTDLSLSAITDTTLNEILYRFGGEEQVESPSCLVLSKLDLLAFANVRTSTKQNFYDIQYNGNGVGGTINGVPFIVDSACKPLTGADTKSGDYCMCYGNLSNYLLVEFSPLEVKRSDDYKFKKGIVCFRGSAICGGNVVRRNGFIRIRRK